MVEVTIKLDIEVRPRCPDLKDAIWMPLLSESDLQIDDQALGLGTDDIPDAITATANA